MKLEINIGKLKLKNPIMVASGTFGYAKEFEDLVDLEKLGAIITKTITLKPGLGNPMPRICETPSGMLNAIGLQNEGVDNFIKEKLPYLSKINSPVIVSVSGKTIKEFCESIKKLDKEKNIDGIELNISCPNLNSKTLISQCKDSTYKLVKSVRELTDKTLITKLSPNVTDIVEIAQSACSAGTDVVSLINTLSGMAIDIETKTPKLANITGGLSGPCIKPVALKMVYEVSKNIKKPVIGIGGIMNADDAIEFLIAGAKAIQIGTANFVEPKISQKIIKGIEDYLKKHKIEDINDIIGCLKIK